METFLNRFSYNQLQVAVIAWAALLFIPFLGCVHLFDWDEINFAESAREMMVSGNYSDVQINFQAFYEKPPLFFWLQVISMKCFGVNEFAARFPNALIGIITLWLVFKIAVKGYNRTTAILWVLCLSGSLTPHLYFKSGIIDPLYNLFIFLSTYALFKIESEEVVSNKNKWAIYCGLSIGLGVITKGPVIIVLSAFMYIARTIVMRRANFITSAQWIRIIGICISVSLMWFGLYIYKYGLGFISEFLSYQLDLFKNNVADHGQPFWYHPVVLLIGVFPISIWFVGQININHSRENNPFHNWMAIQFWVTLILFSIVKTKIVHYSSACYLPMAFMVADTLSNKNSFGLKSWNRVRNIQLTMGLIWVIVLIILSQFDKIKNHIMPHVKDPFAVESMRLSGGWGGYEIILPLALLVILLGYYFLSKPGLNIKAIVYLLIGTSLWIPSLLKCFAPRIETYSQGPAIQMIESASINNVHLRTIGYKSYATYFYGKITHEISSDEPNILMHNPPPKDLDSNIKIMESLGGFVYGKKLN